MVHADMVLVAMTSEACLLVCFGFTLSAPFRGMLLFSGRWCSTQSRLMGHVDRTHLPDCILDLAMLSWGHHSFVSRGLDEFQCQIMHVFPSIPYCPFCVIVVASVYYPWIDNRRIEYTVKHTHRPPVNLPATAVSSTHLVKCVDASFCLIVEFYYFRLPVCWIHIPLCVHTWQQEHIFLGCSCFR